MIWIKKKIIATYKSLMHNQHKWWINISSTSKIIFADIWRLHASKVWIESIALKQTDLSCNLIISPALGEQSWMCFSIKLARPCISRSSFVELMILSSNTTCKILSHSVLTSLCDKSPAIHCCFFFFLTSVKIFSTVDWVYR